jgi:hypothetical protein
VECLHVEQEVGRHLDDDLGTGGKGLRIEVCHRTPSFSVEEHEVFDFPKGVGRRACPFGDRGGAFHVGTAVTLGVRELFGERPPVLARAKAQGGVTSTGNEAIVGEETELGDDPILIRASRSGRTVALAGPAHDRTAVNPGMLILLASYRPGVLVRGWKQSWAALLDIDAVGLGWLTTPDGAVPPKYSSRLAASLQTASTLVAYGAKPRERLAPLTW